MKYCQNCGSKLEDGTSFCPTCGSKQEESTSFCPACGSKIEGDTSFCPTCGAQLKADFKQNGNNQSKPSTLKQVAYIFMIISTVVGAFSIIALAWMIPMTVYYSKKIKNNEPVSVGFKVCTLIFVSLISGILMLCDQDN